MIHPSFSSIPDGDIARVFSEVMEPGAYKYVYSLEGTEFTPEDGFPPERAGLTDITAAFIGRDGHSIRTLGAYGLLETVPQPTESQLVEAYRDKVTSAQERATNIEPAMARILAVKGDYPEYGYLGEWGIEATKRDGKRLIAAHLVYMTPAGRMHEALAYPSVIKEKLPLIVRSVIERLALAEHRASENPSLPHLPEQLRSYVKSVMRNSEEVQKIAGLPPSVVLPSLAEFKAGLANYR